MPTIREGILHIVLQSWIQFVALLSDLDLISCTGLDVFCRVKFQSVSCPFHFSRHVFQSSKVQLTDRSNPLAVTHQVFQGIAPSDSSSFGECLQHLGRSRRNFKRFCLMDAIHNAWKSTLVLPSESLSVLLEDLLQTLLVCTA